MRPASQTSALVPHPHARRRCPPSSRLAAATDRQLELPQHSVSLRLREGMCVESQHVQPPPSAHRLAGQGAGRRCANSDFLCGQREDERSRCEKPCFPLERNQYVFCGDGRWKHLSVSTARAERGVVRTVQGTQWTCDRTQPAPNQRYAMLQCKVAPLVKQF